MVKNLQPNAVNSMNTKNPSGSKKLSYKRHQHFTNAPQPTISILEQNVIEQVIEEIIDSDISVKSFSSSSTVNARMKRMLDLPKLDDFSVTNSLLNKYEKYCHLVEKNSNYESLPPYFCHFAATMIQSMIRTFIAKKGLKVLKKNVKLTIIAIELKARKELDRIKRIAFLNLPITKQEEIKTMNVRKIENAYLGFKNKRIYAQRCALLQKNRLRSPEELLRLINPMERDFLDPACSIHVRFRFTGATFPPQICYKITVQNKLIDVNAFSPRNYKNLEVSLFKHIPLKTHDGWYQRKDRNTWRLLSDKVLEDKKVEGTPFHYSKCVRKAEAVKKRKEKKIEWLRKMYTNNDVIKLDAIKEKKSRDLIKWREAVDFDCYLDNWELLAVTSNSDELVKVLI